MNVFPYQNNSSMKYSLIIENIVMRLLKSFGYALKGLFYYFRMKGNVRIHLVSSTLAIFCSFMLELDVIEWSIILLCIGVVLSAEAINTSIEILTDMVSPNYHEKAGILKDIAAAAVFILAVTSFIIALLIFTPKITHYFE